MKLHLLNRSSAEDTSLTVSHNLYSHFLKIWHFHEEFELVLIIQSSGIRFVGDHIGEFDIDELVLIGKDLPHMWMNDKKYFTENSTLKAEAIAIHFKRAFLGDTFFQVPEMAPIGQLLALASRGIKFERVDATLIQQIKQLIDLDTTSRVIRLLDILNQLAKNKHHQLLSSSGYVNNFHKTENRQLDKLYQYIFQNFNTPIRSSDVAKIMYMNNAAFSRFFKKIHRKSFTKYLNEIRIGYACKLLLAGKESITTICYLSGFNNVSNFNRQFKFIKGVSPSAYLKSHIY